MRSSIREFWALLEGSVHPQDKSFFDRADGKHSFNLDFPPPAFIGDIDNAPVIILMLNGGYDAQTTPLEFEHPSDHQEYIDWLSGRRTQAPSRLSTYYTSNAVYPWIQEGKAAIVNAVAYRSSNITKEKWNEELGRSLPSAKMHLKWLHEELFPKANQNERLVVAHRFSLWNLKKNSPPKEQRNLIFSPSSNTPYLSQAIKTRVRSWLQLREQVV